MTQRRLEDIAVVVPAYNPDENLLVAIESLSLAGFADFVLVDDGSDAKSKAFIDAASKLPGVTLLTHERNRGKGSALKTAYESILGRQSKPIAAIAVDSDGQHRSEDVVRVAENLLSQDLPEQAAVFGVRDFSSQTVPWKSKLGNSISSGLVGILFGKWIKDTQTGLRAFGISELEEQIQVPGYRYEYEMNALLRLLNRSVPVLQVPISTVYLDESNTRSHFRPIRDSIKVVSRILLSFAKFSLSSLTSAAFDIALFTLIVNFAYQGDPNAAQITISVFAARVFSSLLNFFVNKKVVFGNKASHRKTMAKYFALAVANFSASSLGVIALDHILNGHVVWAKIITDTLLFFASFLVQRKWVFKNQ
jgi:dolichol-phosphate mannosyltransferase